MRVIFCDSIVDNKIVEPDYEGEFQAAKSAGFSTSVFSFEELLDNNISKAFRYIRDSESEEFAIYRGWMLPPSKYEPLYSELLKRNIKLINDPTEYSHCHYLPESYEIIKDKTPKSNWTKNSEHRNFEIISSLTDEFGSSPIIVKDYVKSEKHNWEDACYIPNASDKQTVKLVTDKFLALRGAFLNEGLVFRKFEEIEPLTVHSKSGMPLTKEFRLFFAHHKLLKVFNYWDEGDYGDTTQELGPFVEIAKKIKSNFFTMDIAKKKDGEWIIMELGDGQTAGLPDNADVGSFYNELKKNALQHKASSMAG